MEIKPPTDPAIIQLGAGLLGAVAGLKFSPGDTLVERLLNIASGAACAVYLAPFLAEVLDMTTPAKQSGLAFLLGMFGMNIVAALMQGIKDLRVGEILSGWFSRGGPKS
jgi:hypothetical protein